MAVISYIGRSEFRVFVAEVIWCLPKVKMQGKRYEEGKGEKEEGDLSRYIYFTDYKAVRRGRDASQLNRNRFKAVTR